MSDRIVDGIFLVIFRSNIVSYQMEKLPKIISHLGANPRSW